MPWRLKKRDSLVITICGLRHTSAQSVASKPQVTGWPRLGTNAIRRSCYVRVLRTLNRRRRLEPGTSIRMSLPSLGNVDVYENAFGRSKLWSGPRRGRGLLCARRGVRLAGQRTYRSYRRRVECGSPERSRISVGAGWAVAAGHRYDGDRWIALMVSSGDEKERAKDGST